MNEPDLNGWRPCHCLCGAVHPGRLGVCLGEPATMTINTIGYITGPWRVPVCQPCAAARSAVSR